MDFSVNYWEKRAKNSKKSAISSTDVNLDYLEKEFIKRYLSKDNHILDVGSGDGLASLEFAKIVKAVEAVEPALSVLKLAEKNQARARIKNVNWHHGSVLELEKIFPNQIFDRVVSKRCLINVLSWTEQKKAIDQLEKKLKKGGLLLLCEGFTDAFENLNKIREKFGLKEDKIVDFNLYFQREKFEDYISKFFKTIEKNNFGAYYFLSHFFYPLLIKPNEPKYSAKINKIAVEVALKEKLLEEFGYINFYALKRK